VNNTDIAKEWFNFGLSDYQVASYLMNMKPKPIEIICYHCQQCVEKLLKGCIALNGGEILKTHDLIALNKICIEYNFNFKDIKNECIDLTDYGVQVRYPFNVDLIETDAKIALEDTNKVIDFVKNIIDDNKIFS
jgi:HEPN domain-containing protein